MKETKELPILRLNGSVALGLNDQVAIEEPLEIRLNFSKNRGMHQGRGEKTISITMRTPGADFDLALGFLFTEGIIKSLDEVTEIKHCGDKENIVRIFLNEGANFVPSKLERHFYTSSSCGVCGKTSIEALMTQNPYSNKIKEALRSLKPFSIICQRP